MHHSYLDKYARQDSPLHRLDARSKLPLALASVVLVATAMRPGILFMGVFMILIAGLYVAARIPLDYLLSRSVLILPFSMFAAFSLVFGANAEGALWQWGPLAVTQQGLNRGASLLLRAWVAVSLMILLINTTPFDRLLRALKWYGMPSVLVLLLLSCIGICICSGMRSSGCKGRAICAISGDAGGNRCRCWEIWQRRFSCDLMSARRGFKRPC